MRLVMPIMLLFVSCASAPKVLPNCPCSISRHPIAHDYKRADAVFVGTVVNINAAPAMENPTRRGGPRVLAVHLNVLSQYKGESAERLTVYVDTIWSCAYPFVAGETYLVYAWQEHRFKNLLTTTGCVRTILYEDAKRDIRELRKIKASRSRK